MKKLKKTYRTKKQIFEYICIKTELRKLLINNAVLLNKEAAIASIAKNSKRARRLIKRFKTEDIRGNDEE